jgi:hypothetical protein
MSSQGNGQSPILYQVRLSQLARNTIRQHYLEASQAGTGPQFLAALRRLLEHLRAEPLTFGDPCYRLPALRLRVFLAVVSPLVVHYAVHEERLFVFIHRVKVLS